MKLGILFCRTTTAHSDNLVQFSLSRYLFDIPNFFIYGAFMKEKDIEISDLYDFTLWIGTNKIQAIKTEKYETV